MEYEHTQIGHTWWLTSILMIVVAWLSLPETFAESVWLGVLIAVFMAGIVAITVWFSRLTVSIKNSEVTVAFGLGRPHRAISLSDITHTRGVRIKWYYGWGVRGVPNGRMYNVWGFEAVELEFTSGKVFWIGTDEPDRLEAAISLAPRE